MRVGFIGTGSMGSILIEAFIQSGALNPEQIVATNRTISKVERLAATYSGLKVARSNIDVVRHCDILFLCVKPTEFKTVIDDIKIEASPEQIIVSITSPVLIRQLEDLLPSKIAKIIPSITNFVFSGATLCVYSDRMADEDIELLENLLSHISAPIRISEANTRISSDLSSCGPAFLAFFIQKFIDASVEETGISREEATQLASEMTLGTGKLLTTGGFSPEALQKSVAVPGGITAEGLHMMEKELRGLFNNLIHTTHAKYEEDLEKVETRFFGTKVE
ncbi:late competence protein ComER [Paenibacillus sp. LMG 31456]|uniref:Pyrroline-5-carboxylate reductase n=1 Tax=Paenibacillus foliorum TaxID=2654974 RepID=A0A972GXC1_9BACL|nr:late competence protein ComER [Paenibacillus foliorum]NOU95507.1 late competence protein ComER [Paenibacillus foliorum]